MKEAFAIAAALLAIIAYLPYIRGTLARSVRPHAYTWGIWTLVSLITAAGQYTKGAGLGTLPTATSALLTFAVFLLALRAGTRDIRRIDHVFLAAALMGVVLWFFTKDPTLSIVIAVGIDLIAFLPTIRKTWADPKSEHPLMYALNTLRHALSLLALEAYNLATVLHSSVMVLMNAAMVALTKRKRKSTPTSR